jgi:murein DD-endopeptidase MepM/ murein hydrolase activator NlpD
MLRLAVVLMIAAGSACVPQRRAGSSTPAPVVLDMVFPLAADSIRFSSGWGDARPGGRAHRGQDLFAPKWSPVLAVVDGSVDWLTTTPKGTEGFALLLRGDDGFLYYYAHLNNDNPGHRDNRGTARYAYARGLRNGDRVSAGDVVGYVGDSGNAEAAGPHLHFEIHQGRWGNALDPTPSLRAALERRQGPAASR